MQYIEMFTHKTDGKECNQLICSTVKSRFNINRTGLLQVVVSRKQIGGALLRLAIARPMLKYCSE